MKKIYFSFRYLYLFIKVTFSFWGGGGGGIKSNERETSEHFLLDVSIWSKTAIQKHIWSHRGDSHDFERCNGSPRFSEEKTSITLLFCFSVPQACNNPIFIWLLSFSSGRWQVALFWRSSRNEMQIWVSSPSRPKRDSATSFQQMHFTESVQGIRYGFSQAFFLNAKWKWGSLLVRICQVSFKAWEASSASSKWNDKAGRTHETPSVHLKREVQS